MRASFTSLFPKDMTYDRKSRIKKAKKIVAVLEDNKGDLSNLSCLDLGCSMGIITEVLGKYFKKVVGVDVDEKALSVAQKRIRAKNISFQKSDENKLPFANDGFDVIVFNQIYEHVENPTKIIAEIHRVLKKDGICFFGARNKFGGYYDGHYNLPFVAWLPRFMANVYVRLFSNKSEYDISLLSFGQLKNLVRQFKVTDYTLKVIADPQRYFISDIIPSIPSLSTIYVFIARIIYMFLPNYIWILTK